MMRASLQPASRAAITNSSSRSASSLLRTVRASQVQPMSARIKVIAR
jgi:hypothetical protein